MTIREQYYFNFPTYRVNGEYPLILGEDVRKRKTPEDLYYLCKNNGITHILFTGYGLHLKLLPQVCKKYGRKIYEEENATVVGLRHPLRKPVFSKLEIYEIMLNYQKN